MSRSSVGEKRGRVSDGNALKFIPGLTLSQHPSGQRKDLFMNKLNDIIIAKSLHPTEFEGYTIRERFVRMGWEALLSFSCDKIYKRAVIQWVASLSRNGDKLTGIVDGKEYTITPAIIRDLLGVDTRKDLPYARFNKEDFRTATDENNRRWLEACKTVFGIPENARKTTQGYEKSKMTPVVQILWGIGVWTFFPRRVQLGQAYERVIYAREIFLLHALFTGDYLYSFAHLMIDDIWDMYEYEQGRDLPHGYYISEMLSRLGAVSKDEYVEIIPPQHRLITRYMVENLNFSESSTEYIIDDRVGMQRVTFPKKVIKQEAPPRFPQTPSPQMPPHMNVPNIPTQFQMQSQLKKQHSEMMTMLTNMQKQMERQAKEVERQAKEVEGREQERERQAVIRAHAIIWDIERQRYFYEKEQEEMHKAWNQAYGSNAFHYPQIGHTSFHPPQAGSRYYDPTQGNEIPKAFQDIFQDIYGKKP